MALLKTTKTRNKFLILIAALLLIVKVSSAQTEKGNQTLGANLGFQFLNTTTNSFSTTPDGLTTTNKYHSFNIGPAYSYFISNTWALGASLNYSHSTSDNNSSDPDQHLQNYISNSYGGQIFLNKYVLYQNKLGFRAGPYAGFNRQSNTTEIPTSSVESKQTANDYFAGGALDLVYYPAKSLGITLSVAKLTYDHSTTKDGFTGNPDDTYAKGHSNNLSFNFINSGTSVSVFYTFGGK